MMQRGAMDAAMRADLADLRGARFVMTSEVEKEHRLSEGKLKYITAGMGTLRAVENTKIRKSDRISGDTQVVHGL
jgi:hypothetical protein